MEKIIFSYSQSQDAWRTRDPGTIPNYFECYRASDVDTLREALRELVEANRVYLIKAGEFVDREISKAEALEYAKRLDKAIAAAEALAKEE